MRLLVRKMTKRQWSFMSWDLKASPFRAALLQCLFILAAGTGGLRGEGGPYCGIYAIYAGAIDLGVEARPDLQYFLSSEFIPSIAGSSDGDLAKAGQALGVEVERSDNLTLASLSLIDGPWILHVSSDGQLRLKNHWLLLYSVNGDTAEIFDIEHGRVSVPVADVLPRWDGTALLLRKKGHNAGKFGIWVLESGTSCCLILIAGAIVHTCRNLCFHKCSFWFRHTAGIGFLFGAGLIFTVLTSRLSMESMGRLNSEFAEIQIQEIDLESIKSRLQESPRRTVLVDARYALAGASSSIKFAVSLPVDSTDYAVSRFIREHSDGQLFVVFCQSAECTFAEILAKRLYRQGVRNLVVYRGDVANIEALAG